jgi:hypothetical protein
MSAADTGADDASNVAAITAARIFMESLRNRRAEFCAGAGAE